MRNTYFITGTDTGVGKTLITAALLCAAKQAGKSAYALKPVAAGCEMTDQGLCNEDALQIIQYNGVDLPYAQVNPVALKAAKAPHIAAAEEGRRLSLERIEGLVRGALMTAAQLRFIEGAGGWRIPIAPSEQYAQLAQRLEIPVIMVVGIRLGCLNHALLTAEAIRRDGLKLAGWVANTIDAAMPSQQENIDTLKYCLAAPYLGQVPYLSNPDPERVAEYLDLTTVDGSAN